MDPVALKDETLHLDIVDDLEEEWDDDYMEESVVLKPHVPNSIIGSSLAQTVPIIP